MYKIMCSTNFGESHASGEIKNTAFLRQ